jgi:uncharacterized repeat protein (TIGR01451 family)
MLVIILFLASAIGITMLADYTVKTTQRLSDQALLADVYRAITGDSSTETFGYLGDVGSYPTTLNDLIQQPTGVTGWNGPYLSYPYSSGSILYDSYGSPLEYFLKLTSGANDQLAIISRGADHSSSNTASNPNDRTQFLTPYPSDPTYLTTGGNADNAGYPALSAIAGTFDYQNVGTLQYALLERDLGQAGLPVVDACPLLYNINITSHTRPTDTITLPYNAMTGFNFLQGVYDVTITSPTAQGTVFSESVAVFPARTAKRPVRVSDMNSFFLFTPTQTMTVQNNANVALTIQKNGTTIGSAVPAGGSGSFSTPTCGLITAVNGATTYDTWIMPWGINSTRAIANGANVFTATITNDGTHSSNELIVLQDALPIGTVYLRQKNSFTVPKGATIVVEQQNGTVLTTFASIGGNVTYP